MMTELPANDSPPTPIPADTPARARWQVAVIVMGLVAITAIVFGQVWSFEFVNLDDGQYVADNPYVTGLSWRNFRWAFATGAAANWHPLTWLSLMLDTQLFGKASGPMHITNLILHTGNVLLLFAALRSLTGATWRSACVAALFAVHPLHVESVAWISERKDVLSTLFGFLSLWAYSIYARKGERRWYLAALATLCLSLLAKQMLVTMPFVFLLLDVWPLKRIDAVRRKDSWRRLVIEKIPFLGVSAIFSVVALLVQQSGGAIQDLKAYPFLARLQNAVVSYALYIAKTFWPWNLAVFYPHPVAGLRLVEVFGAALLLVVATGIAIALRRRHPYVLVGWLWFLGTLVPVIGLVQIGAQQLADRYSYLPLVGLFVAIVWLVPAVVPSGTIGTRVVPIASGLVIAGCMLGAWRQTALWRNSLTLFQHAVDVTRPNAFSQINLGGALEFAGELEAARTHFNLALEIEPRSILALNHLGEMCLDERQFNQAADYFRKALGVNPRDATSLRNFGRTLILLDRSDEARTQFEEALKHAPDDPQAHTELAELLRSQGQLDEALQHYQAAASIDSASALVQTNLGVVLAEQGDLERSAICFLKALHIDPRFSPALVNLAILRHRQERFDEAREALEEALEFNPGNERIRADLAAECVNSATRALAAKRRRDAIELFNQALQLAPDLVVAHHRLAGALADQGEFMKALDQFQQTVALAPRFAQGHLEYGMLLLRVERQAEAIRELEIAFQLDPDLTEARQTLQRIRGE